MLLSKQLCTNLRRDLADVIEKLDGKFETVIDYEAEEHAISNYILKKILEMENK